ncbi:hypothetical protein DC498_20780 [Terrimonas sp.]|uniref:glycosyltransferase n=1 Tax=Terrimonas sp. TaxID=1914338 RepID=UPI000D513599|nr:glycosyltransferase [Terrimonas sp.]PVD50279.1 hypothetical protein DC498_20780 [Terrimonas sp.]
MAEYKLKLVAIYYGTPQSGVNKKVIYQVQGLAKNGINAEVLFLGNQGEKDVFEHEFIKFLPTQSPPYKSFIDKLNAIRSLKQSYQKVLLEGDDNEIIYLRNYVPARWFYKALQKTKKKVILEILSNNFQEALWRKSYFYYLSLCLYHRAILKNVNLIIGVTSEVIYKHFNPEKYGVSKMVIGNGIKVEAVPLRKKTTDTDNAVFNFTCVAELSPPHGVDRLLRGLQNYTGRDNVILHIVGRGSEFQNLKNLAEELALSNVVFHGFLSGEKLDDILEQTDLAIGALAIHRSNIIYSSILKAREYCARGIPFVNSGKDEEFPESFPYVHAIESAETPVEIAPLVEFVKRVVEIPGYKQNMRTYATDVLSWDVKMNTLAQFIKKEWISE